MVVVTAIGVDTLFCGFSFYICAQFKIIEYELLDNSKLNDHNQAVRSAIKKHIDLIDLCGNLSKAYQPIVFSQFLISSLQLCTVGYQLTSVMNFQEYAFPKYNFFFCWFYSVRT